MARLLVSSKNEAWLADGDTDAFNPSSTCSKVNHPDCRGPASGLSPARVQQGANGALHVIRI